MTSGMLERVIENWLTNTDERGYQIPFCQVLSLKGFKIVHISTHGPFEQGKDIIALDSEGVPCAFQLKAGDVSLDRWRQIRPEIEELLDIPIIHPSIAKTVPHKSFFVLSGNLSDPVRREIDDRNEQRKREGKLTLTTIVKGQLLGDFVAAHEEYLPREISEIRPFLNLYAADGTFPFPKEQFVNFLGSIFPLDRDLEGGTRIRRMAASALLLANYLLSPYRGVRNYWAVADGWIVTVSYFLAMAEKYHAYEVLEPTIKLSLAGTEEALEELKKESLAHPDLLEGGLFDGLIYPFRATIVMGYLSAYQLFLLLKGSEGWHCGDTIEFLRKYKSDYRIFGECSGPYFLNASWYLHKTGQEQEAQRLLGLLIDGIILANRKLKTGLINPYYGLETTIRYYLGLLKEPVDESFVDRSYLLRPLVVLATRYGLREFLSTRWQSITHIQCMEFGPENTWEVFLLKAQDGQLKSEFPTQTQSWKQLVEQGTQISSELPVGFHRHPEFLPLFLLVFPHRIREDYVKFLDRQINSTG